MAAPMFTVNTHRHDPYRTFKFQLLIDGRPVAGLKKMGALKKKTEAIKWRTGGDPSHERILPGGTSYDPITLEQGLTHDPVFEAWAALVNNVEGDAAMSLKNFRKDLVINVLNMQGQVAISYKILRAWVSEYQALPDLDSQAMNTVGIQTLTLQHEGWQRDTSVPEPAET
ncbi:phage tail protein [Corallococcus exiguus]|uniref:phage tail protein n=1 Tax=Corallococcus TaxID=83461 RepID=UPI000ECD397D|nr:MULTISPECIES: phage tail protein [Corallococcus]NNB85044.1 phage tail protein [Corallococcus exiguus]NNC01364.1 phage tail protein [Corallococcus exiguus]NNC20801.1 phage tail protein [Corallococcus exiguus]NPC45830.1 phage tail protein [Corallococcus exiguus]NRD58226.1 phage tail protein [Corallococcus exiguus]